MQHKHGGSRSCFVKQAVIPSAQPRQVKQSKLRADRLVLELVGACSGAAKFQSSARRIPDGSKPPNWQQECRQHMQKVSQDGPVFWHAFTAANVTAEQLHLEKGHIVWVHLSCQVLLGLRDPAIGGTDWKLSQCF